MPRRVYRDRVQCAKEGCTDTANYEHESRREQASADEWQKKHPWRCSRHRDEAANLNPSNLTRTVTLTAAKVPLNDLAEDLARYEVHLANAAARRAAGEWRVYAPERPVQCYLDGLSWVAPEGVAAGKSGFVSGPGFNAHANDFPEGTRLTLTVSVELPAAIGADA